MCFKTGGIRANELNKTRRQRLRRVLSSYVPESLLDSGVVGVSREDGREMGDFEPNAYDKVWHEVNHKEL